MKTARFHCLTVIEMLNCYIFLSLMQNLK